MTLFENTVLKAVEIIKEKRVSIIYGNSGGFYISGEKPLTKEEKEIIKEVLTK